MQENNDKNKETNDNNTENIKKKDKLKLFSEDKLVYSVQNCPLELNEITSNDDIVKNIQVFYDQYSKKLMHVTKTKLEIYNKSKTKKKVELNIILKTDPTIQISKLAVNRELTNIVVQYDNAFGIKSIEVYELLTQHTFNKINKELKYLMDFFFVSEQVFCMIFPCSLTFYHIDSKKKAIKTLKKVEHDKKLIQNFKYNSDFQILIIFKIDLTFDIYNCSDIKFYDFPPKNFKFNFMSKSNDLFLSQLNTGIFSIFHKDNKKIEKAQLMIYQNFKNPEYNYRKSQFYIESIYFNLYFIYFNLEKEKIYIIKIDKINEFISDYTKNLLVINFPRNFGCSTLQFIDNMMLVHNFKVNQIYVYDIKLKKTVDQSKLLCICNVNFYNENSISQDIIRNNLIIKRNTKIFKMKFNHEIYYKHFPFDFINEFALINIIIRKQAQVFILERLRDKVIEYTNNPRKIMTILEILSHVVLKINDSLHFVEQYASQKSTMDLIPIKQKIFEIQTYPDVGKKLNKRIITANQVLNLIFIPLSELNITGFQSIDIVMRVIFIFNSFFINKEIKMPRIFSSVILGILKKVDNLRDMKLIIQNYLPLLVIPEIAEFIVETPFFRQDSYIRNTVIYILEKGKYYEKAFELLLQYEGLCHALEYIQGYLSRVNVEKIQKIILSNRPFLIGSRKEIENYIKLSE